MRFTRRRSDRSGSVRRKHVSYPEALESRLVLSAAIPSYLAPWIPSDLPVENPITHQKELLLAQSLKPTNINSPLQTNEGKIVSGTDLEGDLWTITVHGPGKVIVTDTTPNNGVLEGDINTIQLVGTSAKDTYVTGLVRDSPSELTQGTILFNQLIATTGVKSIELNGFVLTNAVSPAVSTPTGVFLYGGVQTLSFQDIDAQIDTSVNATPYQIVIGNGNRTLKVAPSIYLQSINNLVFDSTATTIPTTPVTTPSVQIIINGVLKNFDIVSASQGTIVAGYQFEYPVVGTTGRTAVQATAANNVHVHGSAVNLTLSHASQPFSSSSSGLSHLHKAEFDGNADAVGIDVDGRIGKLIFKKGLGNPNGVATGSTASGETLPATTYGAPEGTSGYPASGDLGGLISATSIGSLVVGPANTLATTSQNVLFVQLNEPGFVTYATTPGYSLTNAVVATSGSIDQVQVTGPLLNTEIKSGFDYPSFVQGQEGSRAASKIKKLNVKGDLISSVISASVRANNNQYSRASNTNGNGSITGTVTGQAIDTGGTTGLGNTGAGVFAKHLKGRFPATN
jgi:hypothetical protein